MPLHTPRSIWAKNRQPMLELASDGIGVSLGEDSYLLVRWSASLPREQVCRWLAFFATVSRGPGSVAEVVGIGPPGESSTAVSLAELKAGLALLSRLKVSASPYAAMSDIQLSDQANSPD